MSEEEFSNENLAKTKDDEELYPVLVAEDGEVLDGKHRVEAKPNWHKKTVSAKSRLEKILVRLKAHYRRRVPREETQALITELALELEKSGISKENVATELVKILPYSERYILLLLPLEYKRIEKVEAGKIGAAIFQQKIQNMTQIPECERCHIRSSTVKPEQINGKPRNLCDKCSQHAKLHSEEVISHFRFLERAKEGKVPPKLATPPKPTETWEQRQATMKVSPSQEELNLLTELSNRNVTPETDKWICLWGTKPDGAYLERKIAYYVHGKVHDKGKTMNRDEEIKAALEREGWTVLIFRHGEGKVSDWANQVQEALKF